MAGSGLRVMMVTSEAVPFAKAGGLGDMVGALSGALTRLGHDVRVVLPRYYGIDTAPLRRAGSPLGVPLGDGEEWCAVYEGEIPAAGVPVYLLDHQGLYGRDGIYGSRGGADFPDNLRRFALLCRGALQLAKALDWLPQVVHAHDWPGALAPVYLNAVERAGPLAATGSVLSIHNLGYQGVFDAGIRGELLAAGLDENFPAALVANGSLDGQKVLSGTIGRLPEMATAAPAGAPGLLIIGQVAALGSNLCWLNERAAVAAAA